MFQSRISAPKRALPPPLWTAPLPRVLLGFDKARAFFAELFAPLDPARETLFVAYVDNSTCCLAVTRHDGDATGVDWPLRAIILEAARRDCAGLVVAHNHPSGDASPSPADRTATRRLANAAEGIDLTLVDHLVFAGDDCTSFRRMGLL
jgi:DNA repair protein RadC